MREYRFRAKKVQMRGSMDTSEAGEFVFGSYVWDGYEHFIITDEDIEWCVDPETVGQYTGLKDRNGREIYEGDVVKGHWWKRGKSHRHIGTVTYVMNAFMVRGIKQYIGMDDSLSPVYEVIGNKYDNPELLGG